MFRSASRALLRAPAVAARGPGGRRFVSNTTGPEEKSRSWKNTAVRLGLAIGAVYYYNTSSVFSQQPSFSLRSQPQAESGDESSLPSLDSVKSQSKPSKAPEHQQKAGNQPVADAARTSDSQAGLTSADELEQEAGQEAAFNPDTGEINWDCPCLGGMAHGPCGEEFKAAFSCFVYSQEDPKGMDCIDKFKGMQDCFRKYPEIYGPELDDDEAQSAEGQKPIEGEPAPAATPSAEKPAETPFSGVDESRARAKEARDIVKEGYTEQPESEELVPRAHYSKEDESLAHFTREK